MSWAESRLCGFAVTGPVVDPHVIDRALNRRKGKRTLEETCRHYDIRHDRAHDATQDALAAARLTWRLAKRHHAQVGGLTLGELHRQQVDWARQWATGLNQYWCSQNGAALSTARGRCRRSRLLT